MNLLKSLAAVSSMTMFSRVLGFARDAIVARIFGAGMATDAFFVAFKLPNLLRRIFAEGAFSQAFVPILAEYKSKQGEDATRVFVSYVSGLLTLALAVVTVAGMLAAPWVIMVTAPGFADTADKFALTSQLLKITFPYILLISLASLVGAILNTWNRFSIPAFAPTLLNISMIGFALFAAPYFNPPVLALAWAVTVGGVLQLVYQLPHCEPDLLNHQHHFCLVSCFRFGVLDVLRRPLNGVSVRCAGRGAWHHFAAGAVEKFCQWQS